MGTMSHQVTKTDQSAAREGAAQYRPPKGITKNPKMVTSSGQKEQACSARQSLSTASPVNGSNSLCSLCDPFLKQISLSFRHTLTGGSGLWRQNPNEDCYQLANNTGADSEVAKSILYKSRERRDYPYMFENYCNNT